MKLIFLLLISCSAFGQDHRHDWGYQTSLLDGTVIYKCNYCNKEQRDTPTEKGPNYWCRRDGHPWFVPSAASDSLMYRCPACKYIIHIGKLLNNTIFTDSAKGAPIVDAWDPRFDTVKCLVTMYDKYNKTLYLEKAFVLVVTNPVNKLIPATHYYGGRIRFHNAVFMYHWDKTLYMRTDDIWEPEGQSYQYMIYKW